MKKYFKPLSVATILLVWSLCSCKNAPQIVTNDLQRSFPEAEGVESAGIIAFIDSAAKSDHEFHSIMILRHGKVIAEGWWAPYGSDLRHTLYSTSKSFTSTAVGFAVTEKLLTVDDKVISFFPDDLPDTVSDNLKDLTIKHLLTMASGHDTDPTKLLFSSPDTNWVRIFLGAPLSNKPGTKFVYNSLATYMLSAIVQKVTGQKIIDYLTPRLFEPLGIEGMDWETDPRNINTGGWGLRIKTEDMARFGQLYLQKGVWNGKQILPESWIDEATTFKIDQAPDAPKSRKDSSDWMQGYCYQFWRCRNNAYRADGAFGQFIVVIPEKDAVVAITSESPDMQKELNLIWEYLLPAMKDEKLENNELRASELKEKLGSLSILHNPGIARPMTEKEISGKTIEFSDNDLNYNSMRFDFKEDGCNMVIKIDSVDHDIALGYENLKKGEIKKPGPGLTGPLARGTLYKVACSYSWKDENTLNAELRYIESPHHEILTCKFDKDNVTLTIERSLDFGRNTKTIKGKIQ